MNDYMQTPEETTKQPDAYAVFEEIAAGDVTVYNFLVSFWNMAHVFDDLLDGSGWEADRKERAMKALHDFTVDLMMNPFVQANKGDIRAMMVSSMARNMYGDTTSDKVKARYVRCGDVDLIVHIAYLAGGWKKMQEISKRRDYDTID